MYYFYYMKDKVRALIAKTGVPGRFYKSHKFVFSLWMLVTLIFVVQSLVTHRYNNYLIFENTFRNLLLQQSLYAEYPTYHGDVNHYGPVFSILIAPFALLNNSLGLLLWNIFNCVVLFKAIGSLPLKSNDKLLIGYIAIPCLVASMLNQQFNAAAAAFIILSYTMLNKDKGIWSALFIALGTFVKLYGVVGLAFFFFVKDKPRFIGALILWSLLLFSLPICFSSLSFVLHSYADWEASLTEKNISNILGAASDISIMGFFRNLLSGLTISNAFFLGIGCLLFLVPYVNIKAYKIRDFQLIILASALLFPVLFSTGSEDCTYIIAIPAVGIWYILEQNRKLKRYILPLTMIFACDFPLLFFPKFSNDYPIVLAMISVPFFIVWIRLLYLAVLLKPAQTVTRTEFNKG
ncbi:uncharacterized protein DUF2029 [Pedobacter duraquae]|uniref:Uncharacterized protein DUF2029 n=2 Tax=Pedobacter duraquae TaxID=425511 RepID=A0A4R6IDZ7_9SPHI|nr:uncharacterized protein DUF2029 [Pedobacter duraquae]